MRSHDNIMFSMASREETRRVEQELARTIFAIPSINGADLLDRMLPTLRIPSHCIVVLDQGSTDHTAEICARHGVELLQLHTPRTYTQCCNIALKLAQERGAAFMYIANNDIRFVTDVARELLHEIMRDDHLGILSSSQVITDDAHTSAIVSNRVSWDLSTTSFAHDLAMPSGEVYRLEADFCELTCAVLRVTAIVAVGGFDDAYGFYHEDADLGFRLRQAGYTAAYLPQSQFQHFANSTFNRGLSEERLAYIANSRRTFASKHLGFGLRYPNFRDEAATSWNVINKNLHPYLRRNGLIDLTQQEMFFAHPGPPAGSVLYSVWETSHLPAEWLAYHDRYLATYLPSRWNVEVFREAGYANAHYVPLGVETDIFHPWGPTERSDAGPIFLWFARDQYRKGLDVMLAAWAQVRARNPGARLIVMGHGVLARSGLLRRDARHWRHFLIHEDPERAITFQEILRPLTDAELAVIYRSVDVVVLTSRSEGFGFSVVEALACGAVTIFPDYGATRDMVFPGALTIPGQVVAADYSDKNFVDVGTWWEPNVAVLVTRMEEAIRLDPESRRQQLIAGLNLVRGRFTWRDTCFAIRADLIRWQEQKQVDHAFHVPSAERASLDILEFARSLSSRPELVRYEAPDADALDAAFAAFDPSFYRAEYGDIESVELNPLADYIRKGWLRGRLPSPHFDTRAYVAADPRVRFLLLAIHGSLDDASNRVGDTLFKEWEQACVALAAADTNRTDDRFLLYAYHMLLHRPPDPGGLAFFQSVIAGDITRRSEVLIQLKNSPEYKARIV